eukprot:TRINITY_DN4609_c0_g2_i2.p1 TRINITY_DN4609_c0_g2~~TRINITY_DN4609_c0_g2_i2.p1  ORF type:complete len:105 (-),score=28.93 TRINITY_DN4609_c0_g2_i2:50-364(-)
MYAELCRCLSDKAPSFQAGKAPQTFKRILLTNCQLEFEQMELMDTKLSKMELSTAEKEEAEWKLRKRALGNIRFIGELYKFQMLSEKIMHECIVKLLENTRTLR